MRRFFIALVAAVAINTAAVAQDYKALVEVTSYQVSVNRNGTGFRQVDGITPVNPGDLVMASAEGHGWIIYPDCDVEVLPGKVYTVENRDGVVQISDAKEHRQICKRGFPWLLLAIPPILACAAFCNEDHDHNKVHP